MSSNTIIGWVIAAVVIFGGGYLLLTHKSADSMMGDQKMGTTSDEMMASSSDTMMASSSEGTKSDDGAMMNASTSVNAGMMTR